MKTSVRMLQMVMGTVLLTGVASTVRADGDVYNKTLRSTAWVLSKVSGEVSSGTGVLIDAERKLLITNFHVVGEARTAVVFFPEFKNGQPIVERKHYLDGLDKLAVRGRVIGVDRKRDLAMVELSRIPDGINAVPLAKSSIGPGEDVQSIGNPGSTDALWVFTSGTVRSVYQKTFRSGVGEHDFKVVETQAPINSGDSGGPVVNNNGELVAISQAISPKARLVSYSVDVTEVRSFVDSSWKPAPLPIEEVLKQTSLEYTSHDGGYLEVEFEQSNKQKQSVFVTKEVEYYERADVRKVWSLAATLKQAPNLETVTQLLEQSARTKIGAWTMEKTKEGQYLIIFCCKLDATATPDALKSTMEYVARLTNDSRKTLQTEEPQKSASDKLNDWLAN
ncbi:MAG: trypsin-like peptidase domain-containing protein [Planctomycetaceae bacterium]|nr:trypsin-like peptidase domain-containing protein [Planctomycetaceae bacterium]